LKTPEFEKIWQEWVDYRKEIKHGLTPGTIKAQFKKLSAYSVDDAIEMINQSILNGWQGLFELKNKSPTKPFQKQTGFDRSIQNIQEYLHGK